MQEAGRPEHPVQLAHDAEQIANVLEHVDGEHVVERVVVEGQPLVEVADDVDPRPRLRVDADRLGHLLRRTAAHVGDAQDLVVDGQEVPCGPHPGHPAHKAAHKLALGGVGHRAREVHHAAAGGDVELEMGGAPVVDEQLAHVADQRLVAQSGQPVVVLGPRDRGVPSAQGSLSSPVIAADVTALQTTVTPVTEATLTPALDLADFRRRTAELHLADPREGAEGALAFRRGRDQLFASHPQSPLDAGQRARFTALPYFPYDPALRVMAELEPDEEGSGLTVETGGEDAAIRLRRVGRLSLGFGALTLFWITGYGGGLFLPFRDATAGVETYGGGRYLTDTIKGTWGRGVSVVEAGTLALDFNYAYNPSCAYNQAWACPLAPPENRLEIAVRVGERSFPDPA